ncbi:dicarboxylate/amino acid:cation symporter [Staphylococcus equorum]|uniref:hypothetical protein n=1 Tax=Staphylococcus equorum TaxID=246432 RepID=UPI0024086257|nr:hypothetical protein [Staphylococcus equorum]MDG0826452.1 dicarboxylate/amino acid:cation symporter [Staphylococcus equorum]
MEKKSGLQRFWQWSLFIIVPLIVISVFIWQLDNLEKLFKKYPNAIDGGTLLFVLVTTTLSIMIAYKSYSSNIKLFKENKEEQSYKIQQLIQTETKDFMQKLLGFYIAYENKKGQLEDDFITDNIKSLDLENEFERMATSIKDIRKSNIESLIPQDLEKIENDLELINALKIHVSYYTTLMELIDENEVGIDYFSKEMQKQVQEQKEKLMQGIKKLTQRFK